jgi:hypothetical protein
MSADLNLKEYATDRQWEYLEAIDKFGSRSAAARELGVAHSSVCRSIDALVAKAAQHGYAPDHEMTHPTAPGFKIKGTSTLYDKTTGEAKIQWIKTTADDEQQAAAMRAIIDGLNSDLIPAIPVDAPIEKDDTLLTVYPVGDHHLGMLAWGEETGGEDYDIGRGEILLCNAMDYLIDKSPRGEAAILILGDFLHYSGTKSETPQNGHHLDSDTRFQKMIRVALRTIRFMIQGALSKHTKVRVIIEIGNHDHAPTAMFMESFAMLYENEPRVYVDNSPRVFHTFSFGQNMINTHHGDGVKMPQLPLLFAADWPKEWGNTTHRVIHTGHVHHDHIVEYTGATVESHRILAPKDAWAANNGYRALQSMKAIVYHKDHGEMARYTVNPQMLEE